MNTMAQSGTTIIAYSHITPKTISGYAIYE
jgi:hypothetical protein